LKIAVVWYVTPCSLVDVYQCQNRIYGAISQEIVTRVSTHLCPPVIIFLANCKTSNRQFLRFVLNLKSTINILFKFQNFSWLLYLWSIHNDEFKIEINENRCREIGGTFYSLTNFEISVFVKELVSTILFLISHLSYSVAFIPLQKLRNIDILIHEIERTIQRSLSNCSVLNATHI
jgi:hypothetical protein